MLWWRLTYACALTSSAVVRWSSPLSTVYVEAHRSWCTVLSGNGESTMRHWTSISPSFYFAPAPNIAQGKIMMPSHPFIREVFITDWCKSRPRTWLGTKRAGCARWLSVDQSWLIFTKRPSERNDLRTANGNRTERRSDEKGLAFLQLSPTVTMNHWAFAKVASETKMWQP